MRTILALLLALLAVAPVSAQRVTVSSSIGEWVPMLEWRALTLDRADEDIGGYASTPTYYPSRVTVPSGLEGRYTARAHTTVSSGSPFNLMQIRKNGTVVLGEDVRVGQNEGLATLEVTWTGELGAGEYLEIVVWHYRSNVYPDRPLLRFGDPSPAWRVRQTELMLERVGALADGAIVLSGQSNALNVRPYLADALRPSGKNLTGWQKGAQQISVWDEGQPGWNGLVPTLKPNIKALIWWQGESDGENGVPDGYQGRLGSFISRVRVAVGNPTLPVYIIQVGSHPLWSTIGPQQTAYCASDPYCTFISAAQIPAYVSHMDAAGYAAVAQLLAGML